MLFHGLTWLCPDVLSLQVFQWEMKNAVGWFLELSLMVLLLYIFNYLTQRLAKCLLERQWACRKKYEWNISTDLLFLIYSFCMDYLFMISWISAWPILQWAEAMQNTVSKFQAGDGCSSDVLRWCGRGLDSQGLILPDHKGSLVYIPSQASWCLWEAQELLSYYSSGATLFGKMNNRNLIIWITYEVTLYESGWHKECQSWSRKGRNLICFFWEWILGRFCWLKGDANEYVVLFSLPSNSFFNPDSHYFLTTSCSLFFPLKKNQKPSKTRKIPTTLQSKTKNRNQMKHC